MFRIRPFVSVWVLLTFLVIAISGVILYFHVRTLGSMAVWRNLHIWFSFAFLAGALIHLALNWKALLRYFPGSTRSRQWALAAALCAVLLAIVISTTDTNQGRQRGPQEQGRVEAAETNQPRS
ncbi:DUF4405 domain-containing protein [bacterium]|nr:DUF4405 domain-containing protein [bacterium]